jgi:hypothetical protein
MFLIFVPQIYESWTYRRGKRQATWSVEKASKPTTTPRSPQEPSNQEEGGPAKQQQLNTVLQYLVNSLHFIFVVFK